MEAPDAITLTANYGDPSTAPEVVNEAIVDVEVSTLTHSQNSDEVSAAAVEVASDALKSSNSSTIDQGEGNDVSMKEANGNLKADADEADPAKGGMSGDDDVKATEKQASHGEDEMKEMAQIPAEQSEVPSTIDSVQLSAATDDTTMKDSSIDVKFDQTLPPVRKSQRARIPSVKLISTIGDDDKPAAVPTKPSPSPKTQPPPKTPQELYKQIENSRDKLFFIAYSHDKDPLVINKTKNSKKVEYKWHLVRVDLSTCEQLDETRNCEQSGTYYVEFYTKASYDQGIVLAGNPLENGIPAAKMKPKPDSESRFWLEWHEYYFDKDGGMVVGKQKEFLPNSKKAIHRRLMDLLQRKRQASLSPNSSSSGSGSEGEERLRIEYQPDFDKYTAWADTLNLSDTKTRLVGPFDFEDMKPPPLKDEDLRLFNEETQRFFSQNYASLHVKDRVPLSKWVDLLDSLKGRDIKPPTVLLEEKTKKKTKKKRLSGEKRARDESTNQAVQQSSEKKARSEPKGPVCQECGKGATAKEPLLLFPATSCQSTFHVHASCGKRENGKRIVSEESMKKEISSMVEAVFTQTRRATSADGKKYYVFPELKDALNKSFECWVDGGEAHGPSSGGGAKDIAKSSEPLEGILETNFPKEDIASFPVAFAYYTDDPAGISEENAKIATLDFDVEQRRLKRSAAQSDAKKKEKPTSNAASKPKKGPRRSHATVGEKDSHLPTEPAEGFPKGWVTRTVPRSKSSAKANDLFYYSPKYQYKFRSKPEVRRFLEALKKSGGDEKVAIEKMV